MDTMSRRTTEYRRPARDTVTTADSADWDESTPPGVRAASPVSEQARLRALLSLAVEGLESAGTDAERAALAAAIRESL